MQEKGIYFEMFRFIKCNMDESVDCWDGCVVKLGKIEYKKKMSAFGSI